MENAIRAEILQTLQSRRDDIAERWYQAVSQACFVPLSASQVRQRLVELTDSAIEALLAESFDPEQAQEIGHRLAELRFIQPEALGRTQGVLARCLPEDLPPEYIALLYPRLADLLEGVAIGTSQRTCEIVLDEQEQIRDAFVAELKAAEKSLWEARDELEMRVQRRTEELAQANEDLQVEVSERKWTEEMLRESEGKYRTLVENISDVIYSVDVDGAITYISPSVESILGYSRMEMLAHNFKDFSFEDDLAFMAQSFQGVLEGHSRENEYRVVTKSGEVRWIRTSSRPIFSTKGVIGVRGVFSDITERKQAEEALRRSESQYRTALNSMGDAIHVVEENHRIVLFNSALLAWYRELGIETDVLGQRPYDLFSFLPPQVKDEYEQVFTSGQMLVTEEWLQLRGKEFLTETRKIPVFVDDHVAQVITVVRDVTERKRSEEALRESEERLRGILSALHETFVIVYDRQCRHLSVWGPPELEVRYGLEIADFVGKTLPEALPSDNVQARVAEIQHIFETGESLRSEFILDYPKGSFWHDATFSPLRDSQGQVSAVVAFVREITERVRAENALRESEEKWRSLVENAPELVLMVDVEGKILFINRAPEDSIYSVEQIIGANVTQFALPEYRGMVKSAIREVFEMGNSAYCEVAALNSKGMTLWFAMNVAPIWAGGEISSAILLSRDITERKQVDELKDNLIRDVSHELRTPLAKMQMSLELLLETLGKEQIDSERAVRIGEMVYGNVQRLLQTVEAILDLSSLEVGQVTFAKMEILPADLVNEVSLYMQPMAEAKGLEIETSLPEDLPLVDGDWDQLFRVLINLLDNAIKFSEDGRIVVSATAQPQHVEFSVSDAGCGIRQEGLPHVFDRFYQERARFDGAGVGLTICKRVVDAHSGRIWAESQGRGQGATLRFTLPIWDQ